MHGRGLPDGLRSDLEPHEPRHACRHHRLHICDQQDARRQELERFVQAAFASKHAARVCSFMPTLLAMRNDSGAVCSVAGFRAAAAGPLFLEQYLDDPIETAITRATSRPVDRGQIAEVGNLAGVSCRSAIRLVLELPRLLLARGQRWIVFTATDRVRTMLSSYRAPLIELAPAKLSRVAVADDSWGHYYDADPRVMVGYLPDGLRLRRR